MTPHDALSLWENFYVIVGSSAGALTGLQFVVIAIVSESEARTGKREIDAFGTPTVVHFCAVLAVSAIISAPWPSLRGVSTALLISGVLGIVYTLIVVGRARQTTEYRPVLEDWIFHSAVPLIAYVLLTISAAMLPRYTLVALFGIAAFALLLLFIGIRNAWDTVTYVAVTLTPARPGESLAPPPS
ncbi:MAG: hypothetical protein M3P12_09805 [Gemmatimonadota bacterium]|nr:hypothetical protein [Gemmatimonadota bacterium]